VVVAAVAAVVVVKLCGRGGGNGWRARWCGWRSGGRVGGRVCRWAAKGHGDTYSWVCEILEKCSAEKNVGDGRRQREEIRNIPVRPRASMHQRMVDNRCEPVGPRRGRGALSRHRRGARGGAMARHTTARAGLMTPTQRACSRCCKPRSGCESVGLPPQRGAPVWARSPLASAKTQRLCAEALRAEQHHPRNAGQS